jgi:hypothetical protein
LLPKADQLSLPTSLLLREVAVVVAKLPLVKDQLVARVGLAVIVLLPELQAVVRLLNLRLMLLLEWLIPLLLALVVLVV